MSIVDQALRYAIAAHAGQRRKYTGEPYVFHCVDVASLVASVGGSEIMQAAALLHDALEDTDTSAVSIRNNFGGEVLALVCEVTDKSRPSDGNRATRKAIDRRHLAGASAEAQTIKLADLISNTASIVAHDPGFAQVYLEEKRALLEVLTKGDSSLHRRALRMVQECTAAP